MTLTDKTVEERENRAQRLRAAAVPYLLLLPAVIALAAVSLYPTFDGIRASLHKFRYALDVGFRQQHPGFLAARAAALASHGHTD